MFKAIDRPDPTCSFGFTLCSAGGAYETAVGFVHPLLGMCQSCQQHAGEGIKAGGGVDTGGSPLPEGTATCTLGCALVGTLASLSGSECWEA